MRNLLVAFLASALAAVPVHAGELFGGVYVHDFDSPLTNDSIERGVDIQIGFRGGTLIHGTGLQPYGFAALNSAGETHYAAAGLSWKLGKQLYVRPGIGLAVHSGSDADFNRSDRIGFGSRVLFQPELGIGVGLGSRASVEASWVHMSHAQLFSGHNPGIDNVGMRLNWKL